MNKTEVFITTYNDPDYLNLVLAGYAHQSDKDFSICIADDGSCCSAGINSIKLKCNKGTKEFYGCLANLSVISKYSKILDINYVWHEDKGFRRSEILNKAVKSSVADWLIFTDGDCIPHENFVRDHRALASDTKIITGPRVDLSLKLTDRFTGTIHKRSSINTNKIDMNDFGNVRHTYQSASLMLALSIFKLCRKAEQMITVPFIAQTFEKLKNFSGPYGANMAMAKHHFVDIGGFNENYITYGGEDIDLLNRLVVTKKLKPLGHCGKAVIFHLFHEKRG